MARVKFQELNFRPKTKAILVDVHKVLQDFREKGFNVLTLRQLYYQFVARDLFPDSWYDPEYESKNNPKSYNKFGNIISKGRRAGVIDWGAIEDRGRKLLGFEEHTNVDSFFEDLEYNYHVNLWKNQRYRVEVWAEKDAVTNVVQAACDPFGVDYMANKGYSSDSALYRAAQRIKHHMTYSEQFTIVIYIGDHDPSGIDMTRDLSERMQLFGGWKDKFPIYRIALNYDQVEAMSLPPDPAKTADPRGFGYIEKYGTNAWELDAIPPDILKEIIQDGIKEFIDDEDDFYGRIEQRDKERLKIRRFLNTYDKFEKK